MSVGSRTFQLICAIIIWGLEELLDMSDSQARDTSDLKVEKVLMMKCHLRGAPLMTYLR